MPSVTPGQYHIIVRADIFNQIALAGRACPISSKTTASAGLLTVAVDSLTLGVPYATTLSTGQERLLQVTVPAGRDAAGHAELECLRRSQRDLHQAGGGPDRLGLRRRLPGRPGPQPGRDHPVHRCRASTTS